MERNVNLKRAKRLRRMVRRLVKLGLSPETAYQLNKRTGVIRVKPDCARGVYLQYKKAVA